jgi:hypothetical protein
MVRLLPEQAKGLDRWRSHERDRPNGAEAVRRLIGQALAVGEAVTRAPSKEAARKATRLAASEIDQLGDQSATSTERASRKRRLLSGPKEFRDLRGDLPKTKV